MKKLPIGLSDFKEIIEDGYYYVDKTLLIDELRRTNGKVILFTRPRRFGKTLNLSMLKYFYEISDVSNQHLFKDTAIWQNARYHSLQGTYPVIFLTFKSIKHNNWQLAYEKIIDLIIEEFKRHYRYLQSKLTKYDKLDYEAIMSGKASPTRYANSLFFLSRLLKQHFKKRVYVLLDEYDTPIHAAHHYGYYDDALLFLREMLTDVLKDNSYLEKGYITGILRAGKEGIFSGLNNLRVFTVLEKKCNNKFGFTQKEVDQFLLDYRLTKHEEIIRTWYDGYCIGQARQMYNPWSLVSCIENKGKNDLYWANTSDNVLIKKLLAQASDEVKSDFETLLTGGVVLQEIDDAVIIPGIEKNEKALWSVLLFSGYLTYQKQKIEKGKKKVALKIPNEEIALLFQELIQSILEETLSNKKIEALKDAIVTGKQELFTALLQEFIINSMSAFDITSKEPEKSYHLFVLGLLIVLAGEYEVKSNRESGYGRYDIMLIPQAKHKPGIVMEFKKVISAGEDKIKKVAQTALDQIKDKKYIQELHQRGIKKIYSYGIAFKGKEIAIAMDELIK